MNLTVLLLSGKFFTQNPRILETIGCWAFFPSGWIEARGHCHGPSIWDKLLPDYEFRVKIFRVAHIFAGEIALSLQG